MKKFVSVLITCVMASLIIMSYISVSLASSDPTTPTIYCSKDSSTATTGYYCNGGSSSDTNYDDHEINNAIKFVLEHDGYTTVHLRPGTYVINKPILMGGKGDSARPIILEGEGTNTIILLQEDVAWIKKQGMIKERSGYLNNFIIRNIKIDGNGPLVTHAINSDDPGDANNTSKKVDINYVTVGSNEADTGKDWYDEIFLRGCSYVEVTGMYFTNNYNDALRVHDCHYIEYHNCTVYEVGHDGLQAYDSDNVKVYGTNMRLNVNCGIRIYDTNVADVHDNYIYAVNKGGAGIEIEKDDDTIMNDIKIYNNQIMDTMRSGIWIFGVSFDTSTVGKVYVYNNLIYNGGAYTGRPIQGGVGGILVDGFNADITNNTIDDCRGWGIGTMDVYLYGNPPAMTYTINVKNNIITNTKTHVMADGHGYGIYNPNPNLSGVTHNYILNYNDVNNTLTNTDNYFSYNAMAHTTDINQDPLYVNAGTRNYHLKSHAGRYNAGIWTMDQGYSPCIDAGDPQSPYINEPFYNGERINMGRYGNTAEASKSACWIKNSLSNSYIHINNSKNPFAEDDITECSGLVNGFDSFKWVIVDAGGGFYKIRNYWLESFMNSQDSSTIVQCDADNWGDAALWVLTKNSSGYYTFKNHYRQAFMHIQNGLGYAQLGAVNDNAYWEIKHIWQ